MATDSKLPFIIFFVLVGLISLPFLVRSINEGRRPVVLEARIITSTTSDPVFRDGPRQVGPNEIVNAALALHVSKTGGPGFWLAPVSRLVLDGERVDHVESKAWPDEGRELRVFWFSVESANLGGRLTVDNAAGVLRYRTFLAPEMGRGLLAERLPDTHHDDHIGEEAGAEIVGYGTTRLYARVEIVEEAKDIQPLQVVATLGADDIGSPRFPTIVQGNDFSGAVDPAAGELFRLPGFEPADDPPGSWNTVPVNAFGKTFSELVDRRMTVSSRTFAATAATGSPAFDPGNLAEIATLSISDGELQVRGRPLTWGEEVRAGDVISSGKRWIVLLADDGNRVLDPADSVLHCWGHPPRRTTLLMAMPAQTPTAILYRHE